MLFCLGWALLHLPPSLSDDAYRYVWDGQVQAHGINPYQYVPQDPALEFLQDGALYDHLNSPAFYSVYPPVSQLIFGAAAHLFDGNWWAIHYTIKLVFVLAELLSSVHIGSVSRFKTFDTICIESLDIARDCGAGAY